MSNNNFFVARNATGELFLFLKKPKFYQGIWYCGDIDSNSLKIDGRMFPSLKCTDNPEEVSLCLNNEKYHTVKVSDLDKMYCSAVRADNYNSLPWYKKLFKFSI